MPIAAPTSIVAGDLVNAKAAAHVALGIDWANGGAVVADFDSLADIKLPRPAVHLFPRQEMDGETQFVKWHNPNPNMMYWTPGTTLRTHRAHQIICAPSISVSGKAPITHLSTRFTLAKYSRFVVSMGFSIALALDTANSTYATPTAYITMFYRYNGAGAITEVAGARRALPSMNVGGQLPVRMSSGILQPSVAGYVEVWAAVVADVNTNFDQGVNPYTRLDVFSPNVLVEMFKDRTS